MLSWFDNHQFPLFLAPMAGFTDIVYRDLCKREGADVLTTEFVMADSIILDHEAAWETVAFTEEQRPIATQLFGSTPESMSEAARLIEARLSPDCIDLNFGCPVEKITNQQAGSSLLKVPDRLVSIAKSVVEAVPNTPVTAKIRLGWDQNSLVAEEIAPKLQDAGVQSLVIHGRTKVQGYTGEANWDIIKRIAEQISIPVVCNGNIRTSADVYDLKKHSDIRGAMIGRAALGYPWLFNEIKSHLATGIVPAPPSLEERWDTILAYARMLSSRPQRQNEENSIRWMRSRISKLTKDMTGCKQMRIELGMIHHIDDIPPIAERHIKRYSRADRAIRERYLKMIEETPNMKKG